MNFWNVGANTRQHFWAALQFSDTVFDCKPSFFSNRHASDCRADGKPGAAVRKYVHEVQLQEHLDNMRASQQELSPEGGCSALGVFIVNSYTPRGSCSFLLSITDVAN